MKEPRLKNPFTENSLSPLSAANELSMTTYAPLTIVGPGQHLGAPGTGRQDEFTARQPKILKIFVT